MPLNTWTHRLWGTQSGEEVGVTSGASVEVVLVAAVGSLIAGHIKVTIIQLGDKRDCPCRRCLFFTDTENADWQKV